MGMDADISAYEGLVFQTAQLFYRLLGLDLEDLCQELRVKVWTAKGKYDPARSTLSENRYIYSCVANFIKDLKKESSRRAKRQPPDEYIEDQGTSSEGWDRMSHFEFRYLHVSHEEAYSSVEEAGFVLPSTVTEQEAMILACLIAGDTQVQIAERLDTTAHSVRHQVSKLREKLADWRPSADEAPVAARVPIAA